MYCSAHTVALRIVAKAKKEKLKTVLAKAAAHNKYTTCRIFRTAYKIAKRNQAFFDFESKIDVQELNGLDMGSILHSANSCTNIVQHIANEMRKNLLRMLSVKIKIFYYHR